jgi:hypothetical protein
VVEHVAGRTGKLAKLAYQFNNGVDVPDCSRVRAMMRWTMHFLYEVIDSGMKPMSLAAELCGLGHRRLSLTKE